jgi:hypothetical protein
MNAFLKRRVGGSSPPRLTIFHCEGRPFEVALLLEHQDLNAALFVCDKLVASLASIL